MGGRNIPASELSEEARQRRNDKQREWRKNNPEKRKKYKLKWHQDNPGVNVTMGWRRRIWRNFGLTPEDYDNLLSQQENVCAICKEPEKKLTLDGVPMRLSVDHCHKCNTIRGLLCGRCNVMLGQMEEDEELLLNALEYIRVFKCQY